MQRLTGFRQRGLNTLLHLPRRLAREGQCQKFAGFHSLADQEAESLGDDGGLAAAGAGHHQQRTFPVSDGFELSGVKLPHAS